MDLDKAKHLMTERDNYRLQTDEQNDYTLLGLADEVPELVAEVEKLQAELDGHRDRELKRIGKAAAKYGAVLLESNRYKAALEKITSGGVDDGPYAYGSFAHADWVRGVAKDALKPKDCRTPLDDRSGECPNCGGNKADLQAEYCRGCEMTTPPQADC